MKRSLPLALLAGGVALASGFPQFAAPRHFSGGAFLNHLAVGDFDGNGRTGFVVVDDASPFPCALHRPQASAPGTPYASQTYITQTLNLPAAADDMAVGILDGDAYPDVVFATVGSLRILRNSGPASNQVLTLFLDAPLDAGPGTSLSRVAVADWDGDGKMDLVATGNDGTGNGILAVFLNGKNGVAGSFQAAVVTTLAHMQNGGGIVVADFTHDGRPDVAVAYDANGSVGVIANAADGTGAAVNETDVAVPFSPFAVAVGELTDAAHPEFPELIVVGPSDSGADTHVNVAVAQNVSADASKTPAFGAATSFAFPGLTGPSRYIPADVVAGDLDGDGLAEILFVNHTTDAVTVLKLAPTLAGGVVASWGTPTSQDFDVGDAGPVRLALFDADGDGVAYDLVVSTDRQGGSDVLLGVAGTSGGNALKPATALLLTVNGKRAPSPSHFAATGLFVFSCKSPETATAGVEIHVQTSTDPTDEASWHDLSGAAMALNSTTGVWSTARTALPVGTRSFRTRTSAPGRDDGVSHRPYSSNKPDRWLGPYDVGAPAKVGMTTYLSDANHTGSPVRHGDAVSVNASIFNEGDIAAEGVYAALHVPDGCTLADANGGVTSLPGWVLFGPLTIEGHGTEQPSFTVTVGASVPVGPLVDKNSAVGGFKALTKGRYKITKPLVVDSEPITVLGDVAVTFSSDVASTKVGDSFTVSYDVVNRTADELSDVTFVVHLPDDAEYSNGYYETLAGNVLQGFNADYDAAKRTVTWEFKASAYGGLRLRLDLRVRCDRPSSGVVDLSNWTAVGTRQSDSAALDGDAPTSAGVSVDGVVASGAARLGLIEGVETGNSQISSSRYGQIDVASLGDTIQLQLLYGNNGGTDARQCVVRSSIPPATDLVPGSFLLDGVALPSDPVTGRDIAYDAGTVAATEYHILAFSVRVRGEGETGAATPGAVITTQFSSITSDSYARPVYMEPVQLRVLVGAPARFDVVKTVTHSGLGLRETMTITYSITNSGASEADSVTAAFGWPKQEQCVGATLDGAPITGTPGRGVCTYELGAFAGGATKKFATTVLLATTPPANATLLNTLDVKGVLTPKRGGAKAATSGVSTHDDEFTNVCDPSRASLFIALGVNALGGLTEDTDYVLVVGNTSDQAAHGVSLSTLLPAGTTIATLETPTAGFALDKKRGVVTWKVGDVAPHSVKSYFLPIVPDGTTFHVGDAIVQEAVVAASNAESKVSGRVTTTLFNGADIYARLASNTALIVNGIAYSGGGAVGVDAALSALNADTVNVQIRGADTITLSNDVLVVPLGGAQALAFGSGYAIAPSGGGARTEPPVVGQYVHVHHADGFFFIAGDAASIETQVLGCSTAVNTVGDVLDHLPDLISCKTASVVSNGGCNLVDRTGAHLVPNRALLPGESLLGKPGLVPTPIALTVGGSIVSQGGGNIVSQGGGNIVAAGAGNVVSHDGGSATAAGSASLVELRGPMIVSQGGGNLISPNGSNIVSQGGGNIVSQGGGNLISPNGSNIVSQGGGNLISPNGSNIVSQGGGN